ncbi:MAG: hypothetical protein PUD17_07425 [Treponema sp.]|uniref:hypothetical protein n=1 Tax=Treponema sp. TaxID=166 RepID=UPI00298DB916|nr:hypothetical protein [Treponema sp.]MDD5811914.1 hypothetical protein [Treponema sp.]
MQSKKLFVSTFIIFLFTVMASYCLFAQENRFKQKLEWEAEPYALEYKVEIKGASSSSVLKEFITQNCYVEFSMAPGEYLYRVLAYDFLGREASCTEWENFTITKALQPKVNLKDVNVTVDGNSKRPVTIPVDVARITDESTLVFVNTETGEKIEGIINTSKAEDGSVSSSSVVFPNVSIGEWKMVVTNPSGLSTESEPVSVSPAGKKIVIGKSSVKTSEDQSQIKPPVEVVHAVEENVTDNDQNDDKEEKIEEKIEGKKEEEIAEKKEEKIEEVKEKKPYVVQDINLLVGMPIGFSLYDEFFNSLSNVIKMDWYVTAKIQWLFVDINNIQIGPELSFASLPFMYDNDSLSILTNTYLYQLNAVVKINLTDKIGINAKAGAGVSTISVSSRDYVNADSFEQAKWFGYVCAQCGVSFVWIPAKHFIVETGVDFTHIFMPDVQAGIVEPYLTVGVRF